jgi:hypothetical protein
LGSASAARLLLLLLTPLVSGEPLPAPLKWALDSINKEDIEAHVRYLSDDARQGRDSGQPGMFEAGRYIADHFAKAGLLAGGDEGTYFAGFDIPGYVASRRCALAVGRALTGQAPRVEFELGKHFTPVQGSGDGSASGVPVFVGYGISDEKNQYDDYLGVNVRGRIVVCLWHEPLETDKHSKRFDGAAPTAGSFLYEKGKNAAAHGAAGLIVFTDPLNHADLSALKCEFPCVPGGQIQHGRYPQPLPIPVMHAGGEVASLVFGANGLVELQKKIDARVRPQSCELKGVMIQMTSAVERAPVKAANVIGICPGCDPELAKEVVVVGAHYDHVGVDGAGQVFHGADDNGSGTAALLEIVQALGAGKPELARTVVIISFAGEEKGLLGSAAYVAHPRFPLADTVLMVNIDMIGRGRPLAVDAEGLSKLPELRPLVGEARRLTGARLAVGEKSMKYWERSDQFNFYSRGVPALFFLEPEETADYHQITDTYDKVQSSKVAEVAKVVLGLTYLVAQSPKKISRPS